MLPSYHSMELPLEQSSSSYYSSELINYNNNYLYYPYLNNNYNGLYQNSNASLTIEVNNNYFNNYLQAGELNNYIINNASHGVEVNNNHFNYTSQVVEVNNNNNEVSQSVEINSNINRNKENFIFIDESNKFINNDVNVNVVKNSMTIGREIIKKVGDFPFQCKYGDKKLVEMTDIERESLKSQFKVFCYSARNVIFNLLSINSYKYKRNVVVGCIDPYIFYYFFKEMEGAKFSKCYETLKKNGYKEKVPCICFKFKNVLPVLHNVNTWENYSYTATIIGKHNEQLKTKYYLNIEYISLKCNLHTYIVKTTFKYNQNTIIE